MKYENIERKEMKKKSKEESLCDRAKQYCKADSIEEYLLKTNIIGIAKTHKWQDCFWWLYISKNNVVKYGIAIICLGMLLGSILGFSIAFQQHIVDGKIVELSHKFQASIILSMLFTSLISLISWMFIDINLVNVARRYVGIYEIEKEIQEA